MRYTAAEANALSSAFFRGLPPLAAATVARPRGGGAADCLGSCSPLTGAHCCRNLSRPAAPPPPERTPPPAALIGGPGGAAQAEQLPPLAAPQLPPRLDADGPPAGGCAPLLSGSRNALCVAGRAAAHACARIIGPRRPLLPLMQQAPPSLLASPT